MLVVYDSEERLHGLQLMIWRLPLDQFDDGASYAPDIRRRGSTRELNDLRRHPIRCSNNARLVQTRLLGSHTEVCQLDIALLGGEDVGALDVSVDDTLLVEVLETAQDLGHVEGDEVFRELAEVLADAVQRSVLAVPAPLALAPTAPQHVYTHSKMMYRLSELLTKPLYLTMLSWLRFLSRSISISMFLRSATPRFSSLTCLMATVSPVPQFRARYTLPKAPLPRQSPSWKSLRPATSCAARWAAPSLLGRCSRSRDWPLWFEEVDDFFAWPGVFDCACAWDVGACEERGLEAAGVLFGGCDTIFAFFSGLRRAIATVRP